MQGFVMSHLLQDVPAAVVRRRQAFEMIAQVRFDLFLRFGDKAEARPIAQRPGEGADREGA
jgi:hypothetical protein